MLPPKPEFKVEDDLAVGTVAPESLEESEVRKLALERRRSSLKNGMTGKCKWTHGDVADAPRVKTSTM